MTRVLFALGDEAEASRFAETIVPATPGFDWSYPRNIAEVETLFAQGAEAIVTDFHFNSGAFVDWLTLWPLPTLILTDPGDDLERIERAVVDESSLFLERDPAGAYLAKIPVLLRKILHVRDSIRKQNAHVQLTERQYMRLLQAVPDVVYMLDGEGNFIYLNDSIRQLGFDPAKLIGRHFTEIIHPDDVTRVSRAWVLKQAREQKALETASAEGKPSKIFDERRTGERMTRNLELRLRRGSPDEPVYATVNAYGEVSATGFVLPEHEGRNLGTVGIIRDITERWTHEQKLEEALNSRQILLKEIHHRVKNNLQIISSLLNLQENSIEDLAAKIVLLECQNQIQSMAMVHEILYGAGNFESLDMQPYFVRLLEYLGPMYEKSMGEIRHGIDAAGIIIPLDSAIPIALIVSELVTNCLKHAFPGGRSGSIEVRMRAEGASWVLEVEDDGVGFEATGGGLCEVEGRPEERSLRKRRGIGRDLVIALCHQLRGKLETSSAGGARTRITFPRPSP
jgi:PAS domain S-box-containing protein